jgi:RND family efflux transporter MFP subunit
MFPYHENRFFFIFKCVLSFAFVTTIHFGCTSKPVKPIERSFPILITDVKVEDVPIYVESIGNAESLRSVQIRPQVTGVIEEALVREGQYVKKGDPLFRIDRRRYEADLKQAKGTLAKNIAALEYAEARVRRYSALVKEEYLSKLNYEQYQTDVESLKGQILSDQAALDLAKLKLEWTTPLSPINGKISQYEIDPGNLVVEYDANAFTEIRQIDPINVTFNINQKEFIQVQNAMKEGTLRFEALMPLDQKESREGYVYFYDNHIDINTGTVLFKGLIPNQDEKFWPGEFLRIRLHTGSIQNAALVPEQAIMYGQEGNFVYVFIPDKETVEYRPIIKGQKWKDKIVVLKGIKSGEKVVIRGQVNLRPGVKVYIAKEDQEEKKGEDESF